MQYDEYHKYGLAKVNDRQYVKCNGKCCKSGGPAFQQEHEEEE